MRAGVRVLGLLVEIRLQTYDEDSIRVRPKRIIRAIRKPADPRWSASSSNPISFPAPSTSPVRFARRACPTASRVLRFAAVVMPPQLPPEILPAQALDISLFAGEAENLRLDQVLRDAWDGRWSRSTTS